MTDYKPTICTGNASCEGELDWCREEERKEEKCSDGFTRCPDKKEGNGTKSIPGQCFENSKMMDGKENNCLDRSDEDPFPEASNDTDKQTIIDFAKLKNCATEYGYLGLECGTEQESNCILMFDWCWDEWSSECPILGKGIRTNNPLLCGNITFWREQPCGKHRRGSWTGEDLIRCRGSKSGQCMSKGFLGNWGNEGSDRSCNDGSDLYRPITKKPTKTSLSPSQEEEHTSGRDQTKDGAAEKATMTINKRDSAEDHGGRQSQQVWKRDPLEEERYNSTYQGGWRPKEGAMYRKDSSTGLWMIPESDPFKVPSVTEEDFEKGPRLGQYKKEDDEV